jgi:hypothetical protein
MSVPAYALSANNSRYSISQFDTFDAMPKTAASTITGTPPTASTAASGEHKSFWDNLWDVVNPLEHLPVVSTIYDSITHNKVGDVEKIAGDTLYGGFMGLVSSIANVAFEHITGKSFGDTVLGWVTGNDDDKSDTVMAATQVTTAPQQTAALPQAIAPLIPQTSDAVQNAAASSPSVSPNQTVDNGALIAALQRNGMNADMQARALDAYRRTMNMSTPTAFASDTLH